MRMKRIGVIQKSEKINSQVNSLIKHVQGDVISDLGEIKEESDTGNISDLEENHGDNAPILFKEAAREATADIVIEDSIMELVIEMAMKIEKIKATLLRWVHRRRWLKKKYAVNLLQNKLQIYLTKKREKANHIAKLEMDRLHKMDRFIMYHPDP
jgi:hypothetical protein